jgi:hypothetical protein
MYLAFNRLKSLDPQLPALASIAAWFVGSELLIWPSADIPIIDCRFAALVPNRAFCRATTTRFAEPEAFRRHVRGVGRLARGTF